MGWGQVSLPKWRAHTDQYSEPSTTSVLSPTVSHSQPLPHHGTLQDPQVGLAQAPMESLLCAGSPVHVKSCVHPPRVESLFPPVLWSSCTQALLAFKVKCSGGSSSWCQTLRMGSLTWGSELSLLWGNLCDIIIFQFVCHPPAGMGFDYITKAPLLLSLCGFFFVFGWKISFLVGSSLFCRWMFNS